MSDKNVLMDQLLKLSSILEKKESPLKMFKVIRKNVTLRDLPKSQIKNVVQQRKSRSHHSLITHSLFIFSSIQQTHSFLHTTPH